MLRYFLLIFFLINGGNIIAQYNIKGNIMNKDNEPLMFVHVILKNTNDKVISFTVSDEKGNYKLENINKGNYYLCFSCISFKKKIIDLELTDNNIVRDVNLEENLIVLDEVIIQADAAIIEKKDTVVFKAKAFLRGDEEVVEDLLKKIPGINVDSKGKIKVGGKEIERLMVDGDDFFEGAYNILSKNMPAHPIDKIELLNNYNKNRLLKDVKRTDKIALNLKLKKDVRFKWFGDADVTYGYNNSENKYDIKMNLMNFKKKRKFYIISDFNNIAHNAIYDIEDLLNPVSFNLDNHLGDKQKIHKFFNFKDAPKQLKRQRTNFNNTKFISLNTIVNPTPKLKIRFISFFTSDLTDFSRNTKSNINIAQIKHTNNEAFEIDENALVGLGKLDITYDISDDKQLDLTTNYNKGNDQFSSLTNLNGIFSKEKLQNHNTSFDQKINYTNKLDKQRVVLIRARYINKKLPQYFETNQTIYQGLFVNNSFSGLEQNIQNNFDFLGFESHFIQKKKNLLEVKLGCKYKNDKFSSALILDNEIKPNDFQNKIEYKTNDIFLDFKYSYIRSRFKLSGLVEMHQVFNYLDKTQNNTSDKLFYINPNLNIDWKINKDNKIKAIFSYNTNNGDITTVYNKYLLASPRNFQKAYGDFNYLNALSCLTHYQYGSWSERLFINLYAIYKKDYNYMSNNYFLYKDFTQSQNILIKNRELLNFSTDADIYLKSVKANLKIKLGFSGVSYSDKLNNVVRDVNLNNYSATIEFRSVFKSMFNYHIGTTLSNNILKVNDSKSYVNNVSFLDLYFKINKKLKIKASSEVYYFDDFDKFNTYVFVDANIKYKLNKKVSLALIGRNLMNTKTFSNFYYVETGSFSTRYDILPRFVLFQVQYRLAPSSK